jgi:hypothetical protein
MMFSDAIELVKPIGNFIPFFTGSTETFIVFVPPYFLGCMPYRFEIIVLD